MAKRKASDDISARPSKIIRQELQKLDESNLQTKDLQNVALAVYRERRRELPVLPKSRIEAHEALKSINLNTNKDESFMMVNDQENGSESFDAHFNAQFYAAHPPLYIFVDVLLKQQSVNYIKIRGMNIPAGISREMKEKLEYSIDQNHTINSINIQPRLNKQYTIKYILAFI